MLRLTVRRPCARRWAPWLILLLLLGACSGEIEEELDSDLTRVPTSPSITARCTVPLSGFGTLSVEDNYLPHVVYCEMGAAGASLPYAQRIEGLMAQAIAARTFTYDRLRWKSKLVNSVNDQVYRASHCKGSVPSIFKDAVERTRGMVMLKPNGSLHQGYYRAGESVCRKHGTCYGQPCMGQYNAARCARDGRSWRYILNISYNTPTVVRAAGSCTGSGSIIEPGEEDCYYGGVRGVCQPTSNSCDGPYQSGLCSGSDTTQCCLPPPEPEPSWGSCTYGGQTGTCQSTSSACNGTYRSGLCPGPNAVKCCVPWGGCTYGGQTGTCQSTSSSCDGTYHSGLCPGPSTIQCCI